MTTIYPLKIAKSPFRWIGFPNALSSINTFLNKNGDKASGKSKKGLDVMIAKSEIKSFDP
jgi:hypothetical protein